eukprot:435633-Rhodomonas_salina.1
MERCWTFHSGPRAVRRLWTRWSLAGAYLASLAFALPSTASASLSICSAHSITATMAAVRFSAKPSGVSRL